MADLKAVIEQAFENRASITPRTADAAASAAQAGAGALRAAIRLIAIDIRVPVPR